MYLLHIIWHDAVDEMKVREHEVFYQLKHSKNTIASLKKSERDGAEITEMVGG